MKKNILTIVFIYFSVSIYAQNSLCASVEYIQTTHFSKTYSAVFLLNFNAYISLYFENKVQKTATKETKEIKDGRIRINQELARNNTNSEFYYNDKKHFYYMEIFFDQELMVKDPDLHFKWRLSTETKKIGRFLCQKATTHFRGRDYTAWFTPQIPVAFGPWKFRGLSGLILEVYDKDRVLHIVAKNVKLTEKENCKIEVDKSRFKEAMTIPEFLEKQKELIQEDIMKLASKLPKGATMPVLNEDCEECQAERIELFEKK